MTPPPTDAAVTEYTRLISLAVHEMRTPASVVGGYLRMLQGDVGGPLSDRQQRMVDEAEKSCARLVALLAELSELGKLDSGVATLTAEPFDFFALVAETAAQVPPPSDREVLVDLRGPATGAPFTGDRTRLRSSVDVVIRAVVREQPEHTTVVVQVDRVNLEGQMQARVVVSPLPDLERAASAPPSDIDDGRGGLGLGLPLARRVIGRHGGRLWSPAQESGHELPPGSRGAIVIALPLSK